MSIKFDELDKKLASLITKSRSINRKAICGLLHISMTPLLKRLAKLQSAGYLMKYYATDQSKFPYSVFLHLQVLLHEKTELALNLFEAEVKLLDGVLYFQRTGSSNYFVYFLFRDKVEKDDFLLNKVSLLSGIKDYKSDEILKTIYPDSFRLLEYPAK
jgi:DNA-binding Lrp family transcriptional regulator